MELLCRPTVSQFMQKTQQAYIYGTWWTHITINIFLQG